MPKNPDLVKKT